MQLPWGYIGASMALMPRRVLIGFAEMSAQDCQIAANSVGNLAF
jgi:hypothetical protein